VLEETGAEYASNRSRSQDSDFHGLLLSANCADPGRLVVIQEVGTEIPEGHVRLLSIYEVFEMIPYELLHFCKT
jgi:hypothetical protein